MHACMLCEHCLYAGATAARGIVLKRLASLMSLLKCSDLTPREQRGRVHSDVRIDRKLHRHAHFARTVGRARLMHTEMLKLLFADSSDERTLTRTFTKTKKDERSADTRETEINIGAEEVRSTSVTGKKKATSDVTRIPMRVDT